jgi:hypothetical protein
VIGQDEYWMHELPPHRFEVLKGNPGDHALTSVFALFAVIWGDFTC